LSHSVWLLIAFVALGIAEQIFELGAPSVRIKENEVPHEDPSVSGGVSGSLILIKAYQKIKTNISADDFEKVLKTYNGAQKTLTFLGLCC
jgi:hypothetical protein